MHYCKNWTQRLLQTLMLGTSVFLLTACFGSGISATDQKPVLEDPPEELLAPCEDPQRLPNRALTQAEVETLWRRDRANLTACGDTLESLKEFYQQRDDALRL